MRVLRVAHVRSMRPIDVGTERTLGMLCVRIYAFAYGIRAPVGL